MGVRQKGKKRTNSHKNPLPQDNFMLEAHMRKAKQLSFLPPTQKEHGGSFRKGRRKTQRPFDPKRALHLTLRTRTQQSMIRKKWPIWEVMQKTSEKHHVRVYRFANVGNHLHLLIQVRTRRELKAFLREFAGRVAVLMTGSIKGRPEKFWEGLVWSKIVEWGRQFQNAARYVLLNVLEASGARNRKLLAQLETEGIAWVRE
jgi:REP element-mobilizing transposase RayT